VSGCDYLLIPSDEAVGHNQPSATLSVFVAGTFQVRLTVYDSDNAPGSSTLAFDVANLPPKVSAAPTAGGNKVHCDDATYAPGSVVPLMMDGNAIADLDQTPGMSLLTCDHSERLSYLWKLTPPPGSKAVIGPGQNGLCPAMPAAGLSSELMPPAGSDPLFACLYPDVGGQTAAVAYPVTLAVSDGDATTTSPPLLVQVLDDQPPCLEASVPGAGSYTLDHTSTQRFLVTLAEDDVDPVSYEWSVSSTSDPTWRVVASGAVAEYTLDATQFPVGDVVEVRVAGMDHLGKRTPINCQLNDAVCVRSNNCNVAQVCNAWFTWSVELR
jgi:hypothetical protein